MTVTVNDIKTYIKTQKRKLLHSAFVVSVLAFIAKMYITFVYKTTKWEFVGKEKYNQIMEKEKNAILLLWHGRIFMMPFIWNLKFPVSVLVSPHNDGRIIANIFHQMGVETVDGSSNENALGAALGILKTLKKGKSIALVPDGPRGPRMRMTESPIYFAAKTGKPIIMATYSMSNAKVVKKSWDKFMIPRPFSKGIFIMSEPFYVKKDISQEETNQLKLTLEQTLNTLTANADTLMGRVAVQPSDKPKKQRKHVHKNI